MPESGPTVVGQKEAPVDDGDEIKEVLLHADRSPQNIQNQDMYLS